MVKVINFDLTSLDFLLFNNDSGICTRIDKYSNSEPELLTGDFELLDKIILTDNISADPSFKSISETFLDWGCEYIKQQIMTDGCVSRAREILDHVETIYDLLPMDSYYLNKMFFDENSLKVIFEKIQLNFRKHVEDYIKILSKIWNFCEKAIKSSEVVCSALICAYEFMKSVCCNDYLPQLFNYANHVLTIYLRQINTKICDIPVIHYLLTLVKVVVRNETHAICRINFWWRLICSIRADMICTTLFDPCVVPFLANLFGKHVTFDANQVFLYSVYQFNVFSNYSEFGPLCNHVMSQLLRLISDQVWPHLEKKSKYDNIEHWRLFVDVLLTNTRIDILLIAFCFWCQSIRLFKARSAPSDFQLLDTIIKCFTEKFVSIGIVKQQSICKEEPDDNKPGLCLIINKIFDMKMRLIQENQSAIVTFTGNLKVTKSMTEALLKLAKTSGNILVEYKLCLSIFCDTLAAMNKLILSRELPGIQKPLNLTTWVDSCLDIISLIFPKDLPISCLLLFRDMRLINEAWFRDLFHSGDLSIETNVAIANLQCWIHLSCKINQRFDKDSFTNYSNEECDLDLIPFTEYLVAPLLFLLELGDNTLTKSDYDELWKVWEYFYIDIIMKASIIPSFSPVSWHKSILRFLTKVLVKMTKNNTNQSKVKQTVIFNLICRSMRLVVIRIEDDEEITKKNPVWLLLKSIIENFPVFSNDNLKVSFKDSSEDSGLFADLVEVSTGKWVKIKLPFINKFNCDMESNFDLFISLITALIYKISHNKSMMLDIVELLVPKCALLSDVLACRKLNNDSIQPHGRTRTNYDENVSQFENFIVHLINRVQICCLSEKITKDIANRISPFFIYLFSNKNGVLSRSTVQNSIQLWNDKMGEVKNCEYCPELLKEIKKLKLNNKNIIVPQHVEEKLKDINVSFELVQQDSDSVNEELKTPQIGSLLNRLTASEAIKSTNTPRATDSPNKRVVKEITPSKPQELIPVQKLENITPLKAQIEPKEFSSPLHEILKLRNTRKRSAHDLLRKSSDANYVVIPPPQNSKKIKLTDHQKERFVEQKNEYKPFSCTMPAKFSLLSYESTVSLASDDSLLNRIDSMDNELIGKDSAKSINEQETVVESSAESVLKNEPMIPVDIDCDLPNEIPLVNDCDMDNKENQLDQIDKLETNLIHFQKRLSEENAKTLTVILDKYPLVELNKDDKILSSSSSDNTIIAVTVATQPVVANHSPLHAFEAKKLLTPTRSTFSPLVNKYSSRAQRAVQLALENKYKNDNLPKQPLVISAPNTDEPNKQPSSIIRNFWSEKKKGARVSFVLPTEKSVAENERIIASDMTSIAENEVPNQVREEPINPQASETCAYANPTGFESPIPNRITSIPKLPHISELMSDLNNSTNEPQSMEKIQQSLKDIVDQFSPIRDLSYSIVDDTLDTVKQAYNAASEGNKKEIIRRLLAFIATTV